MSLARRMVALTARLLDGYPVTTRHIRGEFAVSKATAKRDMRALEEALIGAKCARIGRGPTAGKRLSMRAAEATRDHSPRLDNSRGLHETNLCPPGAAP